MGIAGVVNGLAGQLVRLGQAGQNSLRAGEDHLLSSVAIRFLGVKKWSCTARRIRDRNARKKKKSSRSKYNQ